MVSEGKDYKSFCKMLNEAEDEKLQVLEGNKRKGIFVSIKFYYYYYYYYYYFVFWLMG